MNSSLDERFFENLVLICYKYNIYFEFPYEKTNISSYLSMLMMPLPLLFIAGFGPVDV